jgi:hypothetical protein
MKHARTDYDRIQDPSGLIPLDEPVFLIRGKDIAGPSTLEFWAMEAAKSGAAPHICRAAQEQARAMRAWQKHGYPSVKIPDMPENAVRDVSE